MIRSIVGGSLVAAALALLLSFKTPSAPVTAAGGGGSGASGPASTQGGTVKTYTGTVTGNTVQTPFGNVQVQVTLQSGTITDVQALQVPGGDPHSSMLSQMAAPRLRSMVLAAQSANVNTVSGATYTSEGYLQSLQSALDQIG
jgi:uncharacterized protein with FMN-binding domain